MHSRTALAQRLLTTGDGRTVVSGMKTGTPLRQAGEASGHPGRRSVAWRLGVVVAAFATLATPALAATTVISAVTAGGGSGSNPLDKVSQRKVVRDASG